jgi:hypothetical protein
MSFPAINKRLLRIFAALYYREWKVRKRRFLYLLVLLSLSSAQLAFHSQYRNLKLSALKA